MKLTAILGAATLAIGTVAIAPATADAAPRHDRYDRHDRWDRHDRGHHYGERRAYRGYRYAHRPRYRTRRVCSTQWRYGQRYRVCRNVRVRYGYRW